MKYTTLILLVLLFASCQKEVKHEKLLAKQAVSTDYCFDLSKVYLCQDKTNKLCYTMPLDVENINTANGSFGFGYRSRLSPEFQPSFDIFSWQTFIALNWPSNATGDPIGGFTDYKQSLRVWEHYADVNSLFKSNPRALKASANLENSEKPVRLFYLDSKIPNVFATQQGIKPSGFLQADGYPLIDRNLNFAVFEEKVNLTEEKFIKKYNLTTKKAISDYYHAHKKTFELPINTATVPGAMEIKASWRILDASKGDDLSRYYHQNAEILVSDESSASGKSFTIKCVVGLVGLHIIRKTERFKDWIWSTFEHVDNVPDNLQQAQDNMEKQWSFYNPGCLNCEPNIPPAHVKGDTVNDKIMYRWNDTAPYAARYAQSVPGEAGTAFGTQVTRTYPVYYCTEQINAIWQEELRKQNSVFANYRLIGSQWTKTDSPIRAPDAPHFLGNTTAETYLQPTASCISCHNFATITYAQDTIKTDFSFIFGNAK